MVAGRTAMRTVGPAAGTFATALAMAAVTAVTAVPAVAAVPTVGTVPGNAAPAAVRSDDGRSLWFFVRGRFAPPGAFVRPDAVTYNRELVPAGARIAVSEFAAGRSTLVGMKVAGLRPGHTYGAHVHTRPCGAQPADSGPHYQDRKDPHQPSTDPAYANAANEVWLDFTTDGAGAGAALSRQHWRFRPGEARSVVIHEHRTATGPGEAGTAGDRLACFTVPFEQRREADGR